MLLTALLAAVLGYRLAPGESGVEPDRGSPPIAQSQVALDLGGLSIPRAEVVGGGPPKDGIPSLTDPPSVTAGEATFMRAEDLVLGVTIGGQSIAYPIKLLTQHEAANDTVGGEPIVATY